jgi:hypothetical protein
MASSTFARCLGALVHVLPQLSPPTRPRLRLFAIRFETITDADCTVLPVGMAQVDSVVPLVRTKTDITQPTFPFLVQKGDPLAYFRFGGSDVISAEVTFGRGAGGRA